VRRYVYATLAVLYPRSHPDRNGGAFIRIKSPIRSRKDLFDIGIAGPIAGFVVAVPVLFFALMASKRWSRGDDNSFVLGLPLIFKFAHWLLGIMGGHVALRNPT